MKSVVYLIGSIVAGLCLLMAQTSMGDAQSNFSSWLPQAWIDTFPAIQSLAADNWVTGFGAIALVGCLAVLARRHFGNLKKEPQFAAVAAPVLAAPAKPVELKPVKELAKTDFPECMKMSMTMAVPGTKTEGDLHLCINDNSHSKFLIAYLPMTPHFVEVVENLTSSAAQLVDELEKPFRVFSRNPGDLSDTDFAKIPFVNKVVVYHDNRLSLQESARLDTFYRDKGMTLVLRGSHYATTRWLAAKAEDKQ